VSKDKIINEQLIGNDVAGSRRTFIRPFIV